MSIARIISIANQKGGVGKTTTAVNLAASLAVSEKKTLLIDMDPQGNASSGLAINRDTLDGSIYDVLISEKKIEDVVLHTELEFLHCIPATIDLIGAEVELHQYRDGKEYLLKKALENLAHLYDFILIDCPPSLGILTLNALSAAKSILIPIQCEYYAMEGVSLLMKTIELVKQSLNTELRVEGILLTMHDPRTNLSGQVIGEVTKYFDALAYKTIIPRNVTLSEAPSHGKPVLLYDIKSRGAIAYLQLAKEVMKNGKKSTR